MATIKTTKAVSETRLLVAAAIESAERAAKSAAAWKAVSK